MRVPEGVDAAEAATLVLSWMTAYQILHRHAEVQAGQRLLVLGGNGAVGRALVELGVRAGLEVLATVSPRHEALMRQLGATPLPREGWQGAIGEGVDVVVDGIAADGFRSPYRALRKGGRLVVMGASEATGMVSAARSFGRLGLYMLWPDGKRAGFYSITGVRKKHPGWFAEDLGALLASLEAGELRPEVAERLGLDDVAEAHARLARGGLRGKLVLDPWR